MLVAAAPAWSQSEPHDVDAALVSPLAAEREWTLERLIETRDSRPELLPRIAMLLDDADPGVPSEAAMALGLRPALAFVRLK